MSIGVILVGLLFLAAVAGALLTPRLKLEHLIIIGIVIFLGVSAIVVGNMHSRSHSGHAKAFCVNNRRQIDGAIEMWALEHKKTAGESAPPDEVVEFVKGGDLPKCPLGGSYSALIVGEVPTCSIKEHVF